MACFPSLCQYIRETPRNPKSAKMCMKFNFISICTYLCGVPSMYCSLTNYLDPISLGTILLECVLGTWRCIGCLSHLQWKCLHHLLIVAKLGWLINSYLLHQPHAISVTSIHPHAYFYSIQPCVGFIMAWKVFICFCCSYCKFYVDLMILVAFLNASQLSLFPLVIFVMPVLRLNLKFIIIQYENIELWAMILNKHHMCIFYDFSLDIVFLFLSN